MARKFLVFQHSLWEGPGKAMRDAAARNDVELEVVRTWEERIPELEPYECLIVLGGGPNVNQEEEFPFLREEKKAIKKSLDENRPYLGFCLGHQLLAEALGAQVGRNFKSSLGFITGYLTHSGHNHPAFAGFPDCIPMFKWHAQAVQEPLPGHIRVLATSADCMVEAISVAGRPHILGLQFDNHSASRPEVETWLHEDREWLLAMPDNIFDQDIVLAEADRYAMEISCEFEMLFENFLTLIDNN